MFFLLLTQFRHVNNLTFNELKKKAINCILKKCLNQYNKNSYLHFQGFEQYCRKRKNILNKCFVVKRNVSTMQAFYCTFVPIPTSIRKPMQILPENRTVRPETVKRCYSSKTKICTR